MYWSGVALNCQNYFSTIMNITDCVQVFLDHICHNVYDS